MFNTIKKAFIKCRECGGFVPFDYEDWCPYCGKVILFRRKEDYISQDSKTYFFSTLTEKNQFIIENWLKCCETLAKYRSDSINISEMKLLKEKTIEYKEILLRCKDLQIYPGSFERIYLEHEGSIYLYFPYLTDNKTLSVLKELMLQKGTLPQEFHFSSFYTPFAQKSLQKEVSKENV